MRFFFLLLLSWSLEASTLQLAISSNPARINPLLATDSSSAQITSYLFNGLVKYDKDSKETISDLAQKFYFLDDTTLIFELKHGVKWHDGVAFSAEDVLFTYEILTSDKISSPYSAGFRFIKSVTVLGKYKLKVKYKKPYFKALQIWMIGILPKHILKNESNLMNSKFNRHPIGTGAYKLEQLVYSQDIILSAFDEYFEGRAKIDKIRFHIISDPTTRFLMLKSSKLDMGNVEPMAYERQLDPAFLQKYKIYEEISHFYTYLGFNLRLKKFQDPDVRLALSLAIDREELVALLFFKHAKVCTGPFLPGSLAFNTKIKAPSQDIQEAKRLLKKAGYDEKNPLRFEIATSNATSIRPYAAEILQYQLKRVGVVVTLRVMEWQAFLNMVVFPHKFDTVLLGWGLSPIPDPYLFWHKDSDKKGGFNLVGYNNVEVNKMIEESQSIIDTKILAKNWQKIFQLITDDNPYLFLYIPNSITVVNKDIKNIKPALGGIWHNYIEWEK